jgi:hypothetical protein
VGLAPSWGLRGTVCDTGCPARLAPGTDLRGSFPPYRLGGVSDRANLVAEAVDAVDEELVDPALTGEVECGLRSWSVELYAGCFVVGDDQITCQIARLF